MLQKGRSLLLIGEVASILKVSPQRTYEMAREGLLPVIRLGRQIRVDPMQLEQFLAEGGKSLPGGWKMEQ